MKPRKILYLSAICASLAFASGSRAETYTQNFDGFADFTTDLGDGSVMAGTARVIGDQLQLTEDGIAGGFASFSIPPIPNSSLGWTATFDLTITDGPAANEPADGFSLNYGDATMGELGSAEEGMAGVVSVSENISFEIDTWMNVDSEQGVNIAQKVGGVDSNLSFTNGRILADGTTVSGEVVAKYNPADGLSFTTTGLLTNADFALVATDFVGDDDYTFILSARVGGANQTVLIDNLEIVTGSPDDTDSDGLSNDYEIANMLDPNDDGTIGESAPGLMDGPNGADGDPDMDNLTNTQERDLGTDPQDDDTDDDGYTDDVEDNSGVWNGVGDPGTDPLNNDSDGDTLLDGVENPDLPYDPENPTTQPGTDPNIADTDDDTVSDGAEIIQGRDPTVPQAIPSGYEQSFDGFTDGTTDLNDGSVMNGTANIQGGQLELTRNDVGGGFASFMIPAIANSQTGWTATFDLTITDGPGSNDPADGMSFNYGNFELTELGSAEEGMAAVPAVTENISFEIDTWMNGDAEQGVNIAEKVGGLDTNLAFTNGIILPDGGNVTGPVVVVYDPVDGLSFTTVGLDTNAEFENVATTFVGDEAYNFGISARVGGANQTLLIDNLVIQVGNAAEAFKILRVERVIVPGKGGNPDTASVTVTWQSREGRTYGVYSSPDMQASKGEDAWEELDDGVLGAAGNETSYTQSGISLDTERLFFQIRDLE